MTIPLHVSRAHECRIRKLTPTPTSDCSETLLTGSIQFFTAKQNLFVDHINDGDTRTIGNHVGKPFEHCTTFSFADVILKQYKEDANLLAEALCSDDLHERTNAQEDMRLIGHSAWTTDWFGMSNSSKSNGTFRNVGAVVLEPGFPFYILN